MRSSWILQTTGFHICKQKTIDNCTWNLSVKFIEVSIFCSVIGKNMISWFYTYVEHSEIKTKTVNIIHWSTPKCQNPWCTLFIDRPEYSWKIARWTLNTNQSIIQSTSFIEESKEFRMQTGTHLWCE
jgi:hypothetical protein